MTHDDPLAEPAVPRLGLSLSTILAILVGGALGTLARYLLTKHFGNAGDQFPTTILLINLSGSLAIGFAVPLIEKVAPHASLVRSFVVVGILGGWTTYSTLAVAAVLLAKEGHVLASLLYLVATVFGGSVLVVVGNTCGRRVTP